MAKTKQQHTYDSLENKILVLKIGPNSIKASTAGCKPVDMGSSPVLVFIAARCLIVLLYSI